MTVTDSPALPTPSAPDPSGRLPLLYFNLGYEAGYKQALSDLLDALVPMCEEFIRVQPGRAEDVRKLLYPFEAHLERRILGMKPDGTFVEGGLGI